MATAHEIARFVARKRLQPGPSFVSLPDFGNRWETMFNAPQLPMADPVEELAQRLYADAEWKALQLATFINAPDGKLISEAVGMVIPFQPEYDLWVNAMQRAAQMQYTEGSKPAGRFALAATVVLIVIVGLATIGRQSA